MTMDNMVKEFENKGYEVTKIYVSAIKTYVFRVAKDGFTMLDYFEWHDTESPSNRDIRQKAFIETIDAKFKEAIGSSSTTTVGELFKDFVESTDLKYTKPMKIKVVHFSGGVTTVIWEDGTKSQVRCQDGDEFDPEKGLALAIAKRILGNKGSWYDEIKKWTENYYKHQYDSALDNLRSMFKDLPVRTSKRAIDILENTSEPVAQAANTDTTPKPVSITAPIKPVVSCSTCKHIDTPVTQIPCSGCDWHYSCWEPSEEVVTPVESKDEPQVTHYNPVEEAYNIALKIRDGKYGSIEEIIGFLGEALED